MDESEIREALRYRFGESKYYIRCGGEIHVYGSMPNTSGRIGWYFFGWVNDWSTFQKLKYCQEFYPSNILGLRLDLDTGIFYQSVNGQSHFNSAHCDSVELSSYALGVLNLVMAEASIESHNDALIVSASAIRRVFTDENVEVSPVWVIERLWASVGFEYPYS